MIWKIIEYNKDGKQLKKRMGDTEQGLKLAKHQVRNRLAYPKYSKSHSYKLFICDYPWREIP